MERKRRVRKSGPAGAGLLAGALLVAGAACGGGGTEAGAGRGPDSAPVRVAEVVRRDHPVGLRAIGTVEPVETVEIRAQVSGELAGVHFSEGEEVRRGRVLFTIDPRPYRAALEQAKAELARDRTRAENAGREARRYGDLVAKDYVTQEQYDRVVSAAAAAAAAAQASEAAVERARLQLEFCTIRAPFDGRAGRILVHRGNLVKATDEPLVVLNRIRPIAVAFAVPQQRLPEIRMQQAAGTLRVEVVPAGAEPEPGIRAGEDEAAAGEGGQPAGPDEAGWTADALSPRTGEGAPEAAGGTAKEGLVVFVDNAVNRATGTILLKAEFPNEDGALWPGQFVDARLWLETLPGALIVPSEAVQTGQRGPYVFVVRDDLTVESRPVIVRDANDRDTVLASGVAAGDRVVTDGHLRLVPGAKVEIQ